MIKMSVLLLSTKRKTQLKSQGRVKAGVCFRDGMADLVIIHTLR